MAAYTCCTEPTAPYTCIQLPCLPLPQPILRISPFPLLAESRVQTLPIRLISLLVIFSHKSFAQTEFSPSISFRSSSGEHRMGDLSRTSESLSSAWCVPPGRCAHSSHAIQAVCGHVPPATFFTSDINARLHTQ